MVPTIGKIVLYTLSSNDAKVINVRRTHAREKLDWFHALKCGVQAHVGNEVAEGQEFPMMITRVWGSNEHSVFNGQCFLDGNDLYWVCSTSIGEGATKARWP